MTQFILACYNNDSLLAFLLFKEHTYKSLLTNSCLFKYLHLHMKIKNEVNISPCNPMGFGSVYCLCTILLPVTLNCFKINNKIISDDENPWFFFLPKLEVFRQIIFWVVTVIFSLVTLIFQNQYKHEGDLVGKDSHK